MTEQLPDPLVPADVATVRAELEAVHGPLSDCVILEQIRLRSARVAPEKAVFRPALPLRSSPGLNGTTMKMTYGEQLKHPNWQRVRLERLSAARWTCEVCGDKDTTLHVHHRRYIKGRMAWDYPPENFAVLCESCHADAHTAMEKMQALLALVDHNFQDEAVSLLAGWWTFDLDPDQTWEFGQAEPYCMNLGVLVRYAMQAKLNIHEIADMASSMRDPVFVDELRAAIGRSMQRLTRDA